MEMAGAASEDIEDIRQEFRFVSEAIEQQMGEISGEQEKLLSLQLELAQKAAEANLSIQEAFASAMITVREELGLVIDLQIYEVAMAEQRSLLRTELGGLVERVLVVANSEND